MKSGVRSVENRVRHPFGVKEGQENALGPAS